jgi:hypothetical protein
VPRLRTERRRLLRDAIAGDAPTARGTRPPVYPAEAFAYRGAVYSIDYTVVESEPATSFGFVLNPVEESVPDAESIPVADLPSVDRDRLANFGLLDESDPFLGFGSSMLYLDSEIPESTLVPDPASPYLVWPEATRKIEVDDRGGPRGVRRAGGRDRVPGGAVAVPAVRVGARLAAARVRIGDRGDVPRAVRGGGLLDRGARRTGVHADRDRVTRGPDGRSQSTGRGRVHDRWV